MSDKITKSPQIRFAGFTDAWEQRKLSKGMTEYTERVLIEDDKVYKQVSVKNIGEIKLRGEQEGSKIGRKRQAKINLTKHPNTLIFTRQTIEQGGIGFAPKETDGAIVTENMPTISVDTNVFDRNYIIALVKTVHWRKKVILSNIEGGTAQIAIHEDDILKSEVLFPKINEQQKIGTFFKQLEDTISIHQRKLELLKGTKKSLLQKMFPKDGANVPEIRFAGFTDAWEQRRLNEYLTTSKVKNKDERFGKEDVLSVSGDFGIVNQIEFQGRSFAGESVAPYGVVETGDVVYTKSPLKSNPFGIIKTNEGQAGIVSTLYAVYKPNDNVDSKFVERYFENDQRLNRYLKPLVNKGAKNDMKVSDDNALIGTVVFPVEVDEQRKISSFFNQLDNLITLHQSELNSLKNLKKSLLQQMFI
ncbi:restriction endonuclease subunit S [Paenibacillus sp. 203]|uniref:restriction endonuclease subunit S n=1 Tax=Paenibacillus sp. 203 TaxID=3096765 RepID=UPI00300911AD